MSLAHRERAERLCVWRLSRCYLEALRSLSSFLTLCKTDQKGNHYYCSSKRKESRKPLLLLTGASLEQKSERTLQKLPFRRCQSQKCEYNLTVFTACFATILVTLPESLTQIFHKQIPLCVVFNSCFHFQFYCQHFITCLNTFSILNSGSEKWQNPTCWKQKMYDFPDIMGMFSEITFAEMGG